MLFKLLKETGTMHIMYVFECLEMMFQFHTNVYTLPFFKKSMNDVIEVSTKQQNCFNWNWNNILQRWDKKQLCKQQSICSKVGNRSLQWVKRSGLYIVGSGSKWSSQKTSAHFRVLSYRNSMDLPWNETLKLSLTWQDRTTRNLLK